MSYSVFLCYIWQCCQNKVFQPIIHSSLISYWCTNQIVQPVESWVSYLIAGHVISWRTLWSSCHVEFLYYLQHATCFAFYSQSKYQYTNSISSNFLLQLLYMHIMLLCSSALREAEMFKEFFLVFIFLIRAFRHTAVLCCSYCKQLVHD